MPWPNVGQVYSPFLGIAEEAGVTYQFRPLWGATLILPPALKRWASPRRQGSCSHFAHKWATSDFAPRSEAEGIRAAAGVTRLVSAHITNVKRKRLGAGSCMTRAQLHELLQNTPQHATKDTTDSTILLPCPLVLLRMRWTRTRRSY